MGAFMAHLRVGRSTTVRQAELYRLERLTQSDLCHGREGLMSQTVCFREQPHTINKPPGWGAGRRMGGSKSNPSFTEPLPEPTMGGQASGEHGSTPTGCRGTELCGEIRFWGRTVGIDVVIAHFVPILENGPFLARILRKTAFNRINRLPRSSLTCPVCNFAVFS